MPTLEGSYKTGWIILYTVDETKQAAEYVSDYGSPIAAAAALIPEPIFSKVISIEAAVFTILAKWAVKKERALGVYFLGNPLRYARTVKLITSDWSLYLRPLLMFCAPLPYVFWTPFLYDAKDPRSLDRWRKVIDM
jgi:hypothetical protein